MPTIRDDAICIRHWDWSETSQTVALFTREHGVIRALAKGSKREKAAFSGGIELLTGGEMIAITKATTSLATLISWDLTHPFGGFRRDLRAFHAGMFLAELIHSVVQDQDPHPRLFDALHGAFDALTSPGGGLVPPVLRVVWSAIVEGGIRPDLAGPADADGDILGFRIDRGGVCADPGQSEPETLRVRRTTIELLRGLDEMAETVDHTGLVAGLTAGSAGRLGTGWETWPAEGTPVEGLVRALRLLVLYVRERTGVSLDAFGDLDGRLDHLPELGAGGGG